MRAFNNIQFFALILTFALVISGCTTVDRECCGNETDVTDTGDETDTTGDTGEPTTVQEAWNAFGQTGTGAYSINWGAAETSTVESFPQDGFDYHDAESVIVVSPFEDEVHEVVLTDAGGTINQLYLYSVMPEYEKQSLGFSEDCDNCKVVALQPDESVVEVNYYGSHNWVLPGDSADWMSVWTDDPYYEWGADAGAHVSTRVGMLDAKMREIYSRIANGEELTEEEYNLGHNLHVALDTSILGCFAGATSQADCHTELVNDADHNAHEKYMGDLPMGYPLGIKPNSFDCLELTSHFGRMICATAKFHPILPTEASNESEVPEMQWMLANGLAEVIYSVEGEYPFNNTGAIASDLDHLFQPDGSVVVAIDNYSTALEVPQ